MDSNVTAAPAAKAMKPAESQPSTSKHIFDKDTIKTFPQIQADLATPAPNEGKKGQGA